MTPSRIGSLTEIDSSVQTSSQSITVPAAATVAVVGVSGFRATASFFSGGSLTLGGNAMTAKGADGNTGESMAALFWLFSPPTGTQSLAWSWLTGAPSQGVVIIYGFYQGSDAGPVRDSDGVQFASGTYTSKTLTAVTGDLIIAWMGRFWGPGADSVTWSGATKITDFDLTSGFNAADGSWAEATPSGNQTVAVTTNPNGADGGLCSIVIKAGTAVVLPPPIRVVDAAVDRASSW